MTRAQQYERDVYRKHPWDGKKVHAGRETIRKAYCSVHNRSTTAFEGVNSSGWLFHCRGTVGEPDTAHRFVAEPGDGSG